MFHNKFYIPKIEKLSFNIDHVRILGSMKCGNNKIIIFKSTGKN